MLKLGHISLDVPFFQAPLSGYSDYAMRRMALDFGAPLTFAGVMLAKSAAHPRVVEKSAFRPRDDEHPVGAQILGSEPEVMAKAAKELARVGYDLIDLNFACPSPKVLRRGRGGHLLKEPRKVMAIFRRVREAVDCPVLMKLRIGFDKSEQSRENFLEIVSGAAAEGVDALIVHGRSVQQRFRETSDWEFLARLKKQFSKVTIIGGGDLFEANVIAGRMNSTGVDGVVIARGAVGNPWIFRQLRAVFDGGGPLELPGIEEQGQVILRHFELVSELYEAKKAVRYFRKFIVGYCKLHPERKKAQQGLLTANDRKELLAAVKKWYSARGMLCV
jgi:tRNA-dihydrouridine synthase B